MEPNGYMRKKVLLPSVNVDKIGLLLLDLNCAAPEIAAANHFWDRIVLGGVILADDYGFAAHYVQKIALDEFAKSKGVSVLTIPTGDGIIIKP